MKNNKKNRFEFYRSLIGAISFPLFTIIGITVLYLFFMSFIDHKAFPFDYIIVILALVKTYFIASSTFKNLSKLVTNVVSLRRLLLIFGSIIIVTLLSFTIDYSCLYEYQKSSFSGIKDYSNSYLIKVPEFFYFSVTTFATVGFGDIVPVSGIARLLVLLEIALSFLIIVFGLANINKIHINEK